MGATFDVTAILKANVKPFNNGMKEAQMSLQSLKNQTGTTLDKLSGSLSAVGMASMKLGAGMTVGLTTPVVSAIGGVVKSFADLEQSLGGVQTLFKQNGTSVNNLAKEYGMTREEARKLYQTMANDGTNVIENANKAFKTAGVSANSYMEQVTSFSATLLQGLGGDTAKAAQYADKAIVQMADNANKMGTSMTDIQNAYQGFAKDNYTMLDNLKLGYGGTASEMARLVNESGVLNGEFEATAENVKDIPFHTLIEAIGITQDRLGITGTTAKEASETVSGSFAAMKAAAQNLVAGLGNNEADIKALMESLKDTVLTFKDNVVRVLGTIWDNLPLAPWQKWLGAIVVAAGPVLTILGGLVFGVGRFISTIIGIGGVFAKVSSWFALLNSGGSALSLAFAKLVGVVTALGAPFLAVVAIIASLVAVLIGVYNTSEEFRNKVNAAWEAIKTAISSAVEAVVSFVMDLFGQLVSWWNENQDLILSTTSTVWNAIKEVVETVMNVLAPIIGAAWNLIVTIVKTAWDVIKTVIQTALSVVLGIIKAVMQVMNGDWSGAWETLKGVAGTIWEGIKSLVQIALDGLVQILQAGMAFLQSIWDAIWNAIMSVVTPIWEWIKTTVSNAITAVGEVIQNIMTGIQTAWDAVWNAISAVVAPIWEAISTTIVSVLTTIWNTIQTILNTISTIWSATWEIIKAVFAAILLTIVGLVTGNFDLIKQAISNAWEIIQTKTGEIWNAIVAFLSGIWDGIKSAASAAWEFIKTTINAALDGIKAIIESIWNGIVSFLTGVLDNIKNTILNAWNNAKSTVSNATENIKSTVTNGWNNLVSTVTNAGPRIVSAVRNGFDNAVNAARNFISSAISVGRDLIMGFVNGVKNAAGALIDAVGGAVRGAIDWAKGLLGIHSPSRVFKQFGIYTDEGFIIGVNNKAGQVARTVGNMAQGAIDAFTGKDIAGSLQSELGAVDGELGRLTAYDPSVSFDGGTLTVGQQAADIVLKMGNTVYRAFTEDITNAQEMELILDSY